MGLFSSSKSSTTYQTTNTLTDKSANAAQGAIAVGAGSSLNIQNLDKDVAQSAFTANKDVATKALDTQKDTSIAGLITQRDTAGQALATQRDTSFAALDANAKVSGSALDLAGQVIAANRDVNTASLNTTTNLANAALGTVAGLAEVSARERSDVLTATNQALLSQRGLSDKIADLASGALERSQTPDSGVTKTMLYVVGAVVAFLGLLFLFGSKKRATT